MEFANIPPEHEISETEAMRRFDSRMQALITHLKFPDQLPDHGDYKQLYLILFNSITRAMSAIDEMNFGKARDILQDAQTDAAFRLLGEHAKRGSTL